MVEEKNQEFLIDVFKEIKKEKKSKLMIIGDGKNKNNLMNKVEKLGLTNDVIFLEKRNDINNLLYSMDVFVFPSLYEGLGIVAIEAQAAGLPVLCSENIPDEANISNLFFSLKLEEPLEIWKDKIIKLSELSRQNVSEQLKKKGYDLKDSVQIINDLYDEVLNNG